MQWFISTYDTSPTSFYSLRSWDQVFTQATSAYFPAPEGYDPAAYEELFQNTTDSAATRSRLIQHLLQQLLSPFFGCSLDPNNTNYPLTPQFHAAFATNITNSLLRELSFVPHHWGLFLGCAGNRNAILTRWQAKNCIGLSPLTPALEEHIDNYTPCSTISMLDLSIPRIPALMPNTQYLITSADRVDTSAGPHYAVTLIDPTTSPSSSTTHQHGSLTGTPYALPPPLVPFPSTLNPHKNSLTLPRLIQSHSLRTTSTHVSHTYSSHRA